MSTYAGTPSLLMPSWSFAVDRQSRDSGRLHQLRDQSEAFVEPRQEKRAPQARPGEAKQPLGGGANPPVIIL